MILFVNVKTIVKGDSGRKENRHVMQNTLAVGGGFDFLFPNVACKSQRLASGHETLRKVPVYLSSGWSKSLYDYIYT